MNEQAIRQILASNDRAVERAMVVIFQRQTADEQSAEHTTHQNGRGFTAFDARMGSYYAKWILGGRHLTGSHLDKARLMSFRYVRQLLECAHAKAQTVAA